MPRRTIEVTPATAERWADLEALFGPRGACSGCWCMHWRGKLGGNEANKAALHTLVAAGHEPGLLAYVNGAVAGWCTVAPREAVHRLERSRKLKAIDDQPVWAIPCFFVGKAYRGQGLMRALIAAAVDYARAHGATLLEAYPLDLESAPLAGQRLSGDGGYTGVASAFAAEGFRVVHRAGETQVIMRRTVRPPQSARVREMVI